ncbi:hypothetical protein B0G80_2047 [Paraburkholderia sp. BL6669N2]|nr:hypothetical protein B0G80_2047 [Paraburkholderia sp. BL6669N2]
MATKTDAATPNDETHSDLLSDCRIMLRFATKNGLQLSEQLMHDVAELDMRLVSLNKEPIVFIDKTLIESDLYGPRSRPVLSQEQPVVARPAGTGPLPDDTPSDIPTSPNEANFPHSEDVGSDVGGPTPADSPTEIQHRGEANHSATEAAKIRPVGISRPSVVPDKEALHSADLTSVNAKPFTTVTELVLRVQAELSLAIAPATAVSLLTSEPPPGRHKLLGGMPLLVKWAAGAALCSALVFAITSAIIVARNFETKPVKPSAPASSPEAASAPVARGNKASFNISRSGLRPESAPWTT